MVTKTDLHRMVDGLPDDEVEEAARRLSPLTDKLSRLLAEAEDDDEPLTEEDERALAEAREDLKAGRVASHDEIEKELGL